MAKFSLVSIFSIFAIATDNLLVLIAKATPIRTAISLECTFIRWELSFGSQQLHLLPHDFMGQERTVVLQIFALQQSPNFGGDKPKFFGLRLLSLVWLFYGPFLFDGPIKLIHFVLLEILFGFGLLFLLPNCIFRWGVGGWVFSGLQETGLVNRFVFCCSRKVFKL